MIFVRNNKDEIIGKKQNENLYIKEVNLKHSEVFQLLTNQAVLLPIFFLSKSKLTSSKDIILKVINKGIFKYISNVWNFVNIIFENKQEIIPFEMIDKQRRIINKYIKKIIKHYKKKEESEIENEILSKFEMLEDSIKNKMLSKNKVNENSKEQKHIEPEENLSKFFFKIKNVDQQSNRFLVNLEFWYLEIKIKDQNIGKNIFFSNTSFKDNDEQGFISDNDEQGFISDNEDDGTFDLSGDDQDNKEVCFDSKLDDKKEEIDKNNNEENRTKLFDIKIQTNRISSSKCLVIIDLKSQNKIDGFRQTFEKNNIFFNNDNNDKNNHEKFYPNFIYIDKVFDIYNNLPINKNSESIVIFSYKQKIFDFISNFNNVKKLNPELTHLKVINKNSKTFKIILNSNNNKKEYTINIKSINKPIETYNHVFYEDWILKYNYFYEENSFENHEVTYTIKSAGEICSYVKLDFKFDKNICLQDMKLIANQQKNNLILIKKHLEESL